MSSNCTAGGSRIHIAADDDDEVVELLVAVRNVLTPCLQIGGRGGFDFGAPAFVAATVADIPRIEQMGGSRIDGVVSMSEIRLVGRDEVRAGERRIAIDILRSMGCKLVLEQVDENSIEALLLAVERGWI